MATSGSEGSESASESEQNDPDRVLAECCWEVHATRTDPEESLSSLRQVSKCLFFVWMLHGSTSRCPGGRPSVSKN